MYEMMIIRAISSVGREPFTSMSNRYVQAGLRGVQRPCDICNTTSIVLTGNTPTDLLRVTPKHSHPWIIYKMQGRITLYFSKRNKINIKSH